MSMKPNKFDVYHLSDVNRGVETKNGKRVFRGYGGDGSGLFNNVIYIASVPLERLVTLKAFVESFKINLSKDSEVINKKDSNRVMFIEHASDLEIDITLNIPAVTVNESVNNLAKIEELQRLILPTAGSKFTSPNGNTIQPIFKVWFKNLISSGTKFTSFPNPTNVNYESMIYNGFQCLITSVSYEPDLDSGFFEFKKHKWPKNIKLNLKLMYESNSSTLLSGDSTVRRPLTGFTMKGMYDDTDEGCFPFGLCVRTAAGYDDGFFVDGYKKADLYTSAMNKIEYPSIQDIKYGNYFFISLDVAKNAVKQGLDTSSRKRYVVFKSFLENFTRKVETEFTEVEDKNRDIGKKISLEAPTVLKSLTYNVKLVVPSKNLKEAKKNCGKIQYLIRMFNKQVDQNDYKTIIKALQENNGFLPTEEVGEGDVALQESVSRNDLFNLTYRNLKVYAPGFIEKPGASRSIPSSDSFISMFNNSIDVMMSNLSIDTNLELGFFTDSSGALYPKEISIDIELQTQGADLITSYKFNPLKGRYKMQESLNQDYVGSEHLFPLNRKTIKLG